MKFDALIIMNYPHGGTDLIFVIVVVCNKPLVKNINQSIKKRTDERNVFAPLIISSMCV